ncbi:MAG: hypothetical protein VW475_04800, partial [Curvibacter sp.]
MSEQHTPAPAQDENQLIAERREKLKTIRQQQAAGQGPAFPNDFKPADRAADLFGAHAGQTAEGLLEQASEALSGLTGCASLVLAPKTESPLKHIEFVSLSPGRALVVLVTENGIVENRIIQTPE